MARRRFVLAVGLLALVAAGTVSPAFAADTASVTLTTLTPRISVGDQPTFRYSTSNVASNGFVRLQELISGTWTTVEQRLPGTDKTVRAPAVTKLGKYTYRMRAFDGAGDQVAQTAHNHDVFAYGNVSIEKLCPHMSNAGTGTTRVCAKNNTPVGGTNLVTWMAISAANYPNFAAGAKYDKTSCRSAALTFTDKKNSTVKAWLKLYQPNHADQVASAGHSQVGHLNATLSGGQVLFDGSLESGNFGVYVGGTMSCWTTTGTY